MIKNIFSKIKCAVISFYKSCPVGITAFASIAVISQVLSLVAGINADFAELVNQTVGHFIRLALAKISGILPISLAETIIMLLPIALILLICYIISICIKRYNQKAIFRLMALLVCFALFMSSAFTLTLAIGYKTPTIETKLGIEKAPVSAEQLYDTAVILAINAAKHADDVDFAASGASVMPYSLDELDEKLNNAYRAAAEKYKFFKHFDSNVKPVVMSEAMSYLHITGVYTYFTGESNINIDFPDYTIPYTQAHEMSHQRGFSREDESNFMAYLVCMESDDNYIKYSGYVNLLEYVMSALYTADAEFYQQLVYMLNDDVRGELIAYGKFFEKYQNSAAAKVSEAVNDNFLKGQGQSDGTRSYGRVVDLAVAYILSSEYN